MLSYNNFNALCSLWLEHYTQRLLSSEAFSIARWVDNLRFSTTLFVDELDVVLLNTDEKGRIHYLEQVHAKLTAIAARIVDLPTSALNKVNNVDFLMQNGTEFIYSNSYQKVECAIALHRQDYYSPVPGEDDSLHFRGEAIQASFLKVRLLVESYLTASKEKSLGGHTTTELSKKAHEPVLIWKAGLNDLLDLVLTLEEKGHLKIRSGATPLELATAITALVELPISKQNAQSNDCKRLLPYFATKGKEGSSKRLIYEKRAKKSLYCTVEPYSEG